LIAILGLLIAFPLSQIQSNLYTNGQEYALKDSPQISYIGYYFKTSSGKVYTGKTPQDVSVRELIPFSNSPSILNNNPSFNTPPLEKISVQLANSPDDPDPIIAPKYQPSSTNPINPYAYNSIKGFQESSLPYYKPQFPTSVDYKNGEFRRFFCKKTNETIYIEIDNEMYNKLIIKDSTILWQMYFPFNLPWKITGERSEVTITNQNIVKLTSVKYNLPFFEEYIISSDSNYNLYLNLNL